jgi:hypothetical protein
MQREDFVGMEIGSFHLLGDSIPPEPFGTKIALEKWRENGSAEVQP